MALRFRWIPLAAIFCLVGRMPAAEPAAPAREAQALAAKIDQLLAKRLAEAKVTPAPLAEDAEFCGASTSISLGASRR